MTATDQAPISTRARGTGAASLLSDERVVWALTVAFVLFGLEGALSLRYVHDEGILSWHFASILGATPIAGFFFQKIRPVLALFYAPVALLGLQAFCIAHVLVAATAIPLTARIAKALGQRSFVIPAILVAGSPLLLLAAPAGHSNSDAVVGLLVGLHLLVVRRRSLAAGVVFGAMLLVRSEVALIIGIIALERAWSGDRRVLVGILVVPLAYVLAGVAYHRDVLWALHYPPTLTSPVPDARWMDGGAASARLGATTDALLCLSPLFGLLVLSRWRSLSGVERGLAVGLAIFVLAIRGLPMVGLFNFDGAPRYLLVGLPALALLLGRAIDVGDDVRDDRRTRIAVLSLLALLRVDRLVPAVLVGLVVLVLGFPLWPPRSWLAPPVERLAALEEWWRANREQIDPSTPVVTNMRLARAWLELRGARPETEPPPWFVMQHDMSHELTTLLDADVGQDRAVFGAMDAHFFGRPVPADRLSVDAWPAGTIVVFDGDARLDETIDLARWRERMVIDLARPDLTIAHLAPAEAAP